MNRTMQRLRTMTSAMACALLLVSHALAQTTGPSKHTGRGQSAAARGGNPSVGNGAQAGARGQAVQARGDRSADGASRSAADRSVANPAKASDGQSNATAPAGASGKAVAPYRGRWVDRGYSVSRNYSRISPNCGGRSYSNRLGSAPVLTVDSRQPLTHVLAFGAKGSRGRGNALPSGATSIEVWGKVGSPPPKDSSELVCGAVARGNSYTVSFDANQAGTTAYYAIRYVNSQGAGPFSKIVSASVNR